MRISSAMAERAGPCRARSGRYGPARRSETVARDTPARTATSDWRQRRRTRTARNAAPTRMSSMRRWWRMPAYRRSSRACRACRARRPARSGRWACACRACCAARRAIDPLCSSRRGWAMMWHMARPDDLSATRFDTRLAHLGRTTAARERTVNPPLSRASTVLFDSLAELHEARAGVAYEAPRYGIYGTSTTFELQTAMAQLCGAESLSRHAQRPDRHRCHARRARHTRRTHPHPGRGLRAHAQPRRA